MRLLPLLALLACAASPSPSSPVLAPSVETATAPAWRDPAASTVAAAFPLPSGAERVPTDAFGEHLRTLALRPPGTPVRTYAGHALRTGPVRVVDLPLTRGDLQQCADTAIRLRAEWAREAGAPVSFHATSGDPIPWSRVQGGEMPSVARDRIVWKPGSMSWESYLRFVFSYAGTASLEAHDTVPADAPRAGDLMVQGGFPGHAVVLLDVARRGEETWVLVGQGFMPAQDMHVLIGPEGGWWRWEEPLALPSWTFERRHLRRFADAR